MSHAVLPSAALLALTLTPAAGVELVHAPEVGSSRSLAITAVRELTGGELAVEMGGQEVPAVYLPELHMGMTDERTLRFVETEEPEEDGARVWVRRYDELAWTNEGEFSMKMGPQDQTEPWSSDVETELADAVVRFVDGEDGPEGEWLRGGDDVDPETLTPRFDLACLLPDESVEPGDGWDVDGEGLGFLFDLGQDLEWDVPEEAAQWLAPEITAQEYEGELTFTLEETRDVDGTQVARCTVTGELVRHARLPGDLSQVPVVDGTATDHVEETWAVEGELHWDLGAGEVRSLFLEGPFDSVTRTVRDPDQGGSTYESTFELGGTQRLELESERTDDRVTVAGR